MFTITIGKADTSCPDKITLTSGMVNAVQVAFAFSEEWEGFDKIAVFSNGATTVDVTLDEKDRCYVPHEVLSVAGRDVNVGVYGSKGEGEDYVAIPTEKCSLGKVSEGVDPSGEESAEPTPTIWDNLNIRVTNLETHMDEHTHDVARAGISLVPLTELYENGKLTYTEYTPGTTTIEDNRIEALSVYVAIKYSGYVEFDINGGAEELTIDGVETDIGGSEPSIIYNFKGYLNDGIRFRVTTGDAILNWYQQTFTDGFMSGEDKEKLDALSESVGNIDTALDELHAYAQGLISGGASE